MSGSVQIVLPPCPIFSPLVSCSLRGYFALFLKWLDTWRQVVTSHVTAKWWHKYFLTASFARAVKIIFDFSLFILIVALLILQPLKERPKICEISLLSKRPWKAFALLSYYQRFADFDGPKEAENWEGMKGLYIAVISARSRFCLCNIIYHQFMNFYCHANEGTNQDHQASLPTKKQISNAEI